MNILFFVSEFPSISQTFILNQMTGLIDAGHDVRILAKKQGGGGKVHDAVLQYRLLDRVIYYGPGGAGRPGKGLRFFGGLCAHTAARFFRKNYIGGSVPFHDLIRYPNLILLIRTLNRVDLSDRDVILAHFGPNGLLAQKCRALGLLHGRLFTVFHGYDMLRYLKQKGSGVYRDLFDSDCTLLPISRAWADRCLKLGARPGKIIVHHMGINVEEFMGRSPERGEEINIVSAARFVEKKGLTYGIDAVGRVIEKGYSVRYAIAGDGPLRDALLKQIAARHLTDRVRLVGWKTQEEWIEMMKDAHIVLAPSITARDGDMEGIPVQLMEAMAMKKIVVSTFHSGIPELIQNGVNGYLVAEKNSGQLAQTIEQIIKTPETWESLTENARRTIVGHYNIERQNGRLIRILEGEDVP